MASPIGHAMVGLTAAAVAAEVFDVNGATLWVGAFVASGLPDLDVIFGFIGLDAKTFHRGASHSLVVIVALSALGWLLLPFGALPIPREVFVCWAVAWISHPLVDLISTGPGLAEEGYAIAIWWPLSSRRRFVQHPLFETRDPHRWRSLAEGWKGLKPEILWLLPFSIVGAVLVVLL